jgi:hypothetical protein
MVFLVDGKRVIAASASAAASRIAKRKYGKRTGVNRETGDPRGGGVFTMWERTAGGQARIGKLHVQSATPNPRRRNAGGTSTASRTATEATTTGNKTSTSTGGASTSGGNVSISVKHNPAARVGGNGVTLHKMASITIKRLPGGAVAITGRKLGSMGRANPGRKAQAFAAKMNRKEPGTATVRTTR